MTTEQPGTSWVLRLGGGLYWTGDMIEHVLLGERRQFPVYAMEKAKAQRFGDRASAVFSASIFALGPDVEPVELEFAA